MFKMMLLIFGVVGLLFPSLAAAESWVLWRAEMQHPFDPELTGERAEAITRTHFANSRGNPWRAMKPYPSAQGCYDANVAEAPVDANAAVHDGGRAVSRCSKSGPRLRTFPPSSSGSPSAGPLAPSRVGRESESENATPIHRPDRR